jgi:hypothetical protein
MCVTTVHRKSRASRSLIHNTVLLHRLTAAKFFFQIARSKIAALPLSWRTHHFLVFAKIVKRLIV